MDATVPPGGDVGRHTDLDSEGSTTKAVEQAPCRAELSAPRTRIE